MAVGEYDRSGTLTFGPVTLGLANQQYQVVLDYVNSDVTYLPLYITRLGADQQPIDLFTTDTTVVTTGYRVALNEDFPKANPSPPANPHAMTPVVVPLYVGLGLRLMSTVTVGSTNANLSSVGALAAEAEAGNVTGTLVVQTLGVTGRPVSTALPLPSELNRTAVSNAILALGAIKASLFDSTTVIAPRVVGVYNPIGGDQALVSGIISTLASSDIPWEASCSGEGA